MGLFDKAKKAAAQAQQAFAQQAGQQQGDGMVHVEGAGPIDPATLGGPSTRSTAGCSEWASRWPSGSSSASSSATDGNHQMPNPFKDWARMYGANKQYLQSQGRPSSFLGQIGDIPNRIHEAADASEIGLKMMRHSQLTNGAGLPATVTIDGVWQVGSYLNMSPVLRVQGRVQCDGPGPSEPYGAVFDEVVAQMHIARMQPGATIAVFVDPQNPVDMAIDWIRTGQLGPPPPGSTPGPGEPGARPG